MQTQIQTTVLAPDPARYDMTGRKLTTTLHTIDACISAGLAQRLVRYANQVMCDGGFDAAAAAWEVSVYTVDGDEKPADRSYCVRWTNPKGGYIEVIGILTKHGWPALDHGFYIGQE